MARKLRILLVFGTYPPMRDGGADFVYNLAYYLSKRGIEVVVVTTNKVADTYLMNRDGAEIVVLPIMKKWHGSNDANNFRKALREIKPDVIHVIYPSSYFGNDYRVPFSLKFLSKTPIVTTFFSLFVTGSYFRTKLGTLSLILSSDRVVSHSYEYIKFFKKYFPFKKEAISLIPVSSNMPITPCSFSRAELRRRYGLEKDKLYVSFSGQIDVSKGVDTLFEALSIIVLRGRTDVRIIMVGSGDRRCFAEERGYEEKYMRYDESILRLEEKLGLKGYIVWTSYLPPEDFNNYMRCSDICVLPFRGNTLGRSSLMNALSLGVPVITTAPAGTPFLKDGENVVNVPLNNPVILADRILGLLDSPELMTRVGEGGKKLFFEEFTWYSVVDKTVKLYEGLL